MGLSRIDAFVRALAECDVPADLCNQYALGPRANAHRRENLRCYLRQMQKLSPRVLLVGEAPSYRGARITGVPFTSERLMLGGLGAFGLFGEDAGYRRITPLGAAGREASATIVWETLAKLSVPPLLWNAVPFHPYQFGEPLSNRTPRFCERQLGASFLSALIALYRIERIIAVGNVAEKSLCEIGFRCEKVRHPAQGGKNQFVAGLRALLAAEESQNDASQGDKRHGTELSGDIGARRTLRDD